MQEHLPARSDRLINQMKFYELTYSHMGGRTFPWASGYGPLPDMPFFERMPPIVHERRLQYWKVNPSPPGMEIDPGGRNWSDIIGCGLGWPDKFVSENIIRDLNQLSIPILHYTEMPIGKIMAKALQKKQAPKYFVLEAEPGLEVWREEISAEEQIAARKNNPGCFFLPARLKGKKDSWNGKDLISPLHASGNLATCSLYCTDRIKELAEQKGWTNVKFVEVDVL